MKTDTEKLPKRKHPRLDTYDYSSTGLYFITICAHNRNCIFSRVVGRGLAPAACEKISVEYTDYGTIAENQLFMLKNRYPTLRIYSYVIMPNHIHLVINPSCGAAGASPRPTIMDIICAYKSLTTRECKRLRPTDRIFQTSFFEHIIRNKEVYEKTLKYIRDNPAHWLYDPLYQSVE